MESTIRDFVKTRFRAGIGTKRLDVETPLFSSGVVDSFGVLELIAFLEDTFDVDVDPAKHELLEFDTIASIVALVPTLPHRKGGR